MAKKIEIKVTQEIRVELMKEFPVCEKTIYNALKKAENSLSYMLLEKDHLVQVLNSYMGLLKWCNAYRLRRSVLERVKQSRWGEVLDVDEKDWLKVSVKPKYTTLEYYKRKNKKRKREMLLACSI